MAFVVTWVANSLALYCIAYVLGGRGIEVASLGAAFIAGAILTVVNAVVKPILLVLTLPLTIVTLGLFYFVLSAICLWITAALVPGIGVHGVFATILAAILVSLLSALIQRVMRPRR
jgi:putative membrane protein